MAAKLRTTSPSMQQLLDRWRSIVDEDEHIIDHDNASKLSRLQNLKNRWFSDACNFLISTSKEKHIWCSYGDVIDPLLETFCNYYKEEGGGSPLKVLWKRMCYEMRGCTQCVSRHHRAQETCKEAYEPSVVDSLLGVLRTLDEERVVVHLKEVNGRMAQGGYDAEANCGEIVSLMFVVLTFPILLDDQCLANEFQVFIEAVDNTHELSFASKQFP